ncbi:hypothetical protein RND71_030140 [Anisodus tanguticus]|uniref:Uncharacterized protein n=1 Tax=Anisodus tanguticus TaxID=243964 RepID=A0AAE1V0T4_9SOLA|nr:hypothetical protein RND71_030140 [Anisodus tanguticus]
MSSLQFVLRGLVIFVSLSTFFSFYSVAFFMHDEDICRHFYGMHDEFDVKSLAARVDEVLNKMETLQNKLEQTCKQMGKNKFELSRSNVSRLEYKRLLKEEIHNNPNNSQVTQLILLGIKPLTERSSYETTIKLSFNSKQDRHQLYEFTSNCQYISCTTSKD